MFKIISNGIPEINISRSNNNDYFDNLFQLLKIGFFLYKNIIIILNNNYKNMSNLSSDYYFSFNNKIDNIIKDYILRFYSYDDENPFYKMK